MGRVDPEKTLYKFSTITRIETNFKIMSITLHNVTSETLKPYLESKGIKYILDEPNYIIIIDDTLHLADILKILENDLMVNAGSIVKLNLLINRLNNLEPKSRVQLSNISKVSQSSIKSLIEGGQIGHKNLNKVLTALGYQITINQ